MKHIGNGELDREFWEIEAKRRMGTKVFLFFFIHFILVVNLCIGNYTN